ncbi:MAG TPA: bestrophin family ion channel, partial [Flavobacterium sp.]|uniref:bestrophin family protein n=1 Tax=Flavobacterium sp. TaxID=239 RepID=UPI002ED27A54
YAVKKRLIYRHIAWLYNHRSQLLIPSPWEHISQNGHTSKIAEYYQNSFGVGLVQEDIAKINHKELLAPDEQKRISTCRNPVVQLINEQSKDLASIREMGLLEDFRHMELVTILRSFYEHQGKNERIKKFPIPRTFASLSNIFVGIFIFLLPFSMIPELMKVASYGICLAVPLTILIGWVYIMMEVVGDYSENPFQGMANDIPMLSLCRTIEIDLREMLGEKNLPEPIKAKGNVLM